MTKSFVSLWILLFIPTLAISQEAAKAPEAIKGDVGSGSNLSDGALKYECKNGAGLRTVEVVSEANPGKAPCRVEYTKVSDNGAAETLWNAANDFNYCEEKAAGFVTKLEGLGWTCAGK